jgi:alpha-tubulin suppressor-like RCC1 family protein
MKAARWACLLVATACGYDHTVLGARGGAAGAGNAEELASVSAGQSHACASRGGTVWCWGDDSGTGDHVLLSPSALETLGGVKLLGAGQRHTCGLRSTAVWCWGNNDLGQLGVGDTETHAEPMLVGSLAATQALGVGYTHSCAVTGKGELWCWGSNTWGELGGSEFSATACFPAPRRIGTGSDWFAISAGQYHSCGLRGPGTLWCWGIADERLGLGSTSGTPLLEPKQVGSATNWVSIDAGQADGCGIRANGTLWCWGVEGPDPTPVPKPEQIGTDKDWSSVSTDIFARCAIKEDHSLWCWGRNVEGQLGLGDTEDREAPTVVTEPPLWNQVSVGRFATCGLDIDGELWCSGENSSGQLGQGDTRRRNVMTHVPVP